MDDENPNLEPLTLTKAIFELRIGSLSLLEHISNCFKHENIFLQVRNYLEDVVKQRYNFKVNELEEGTILLINGALFPYPLIEKVKIDESKKFFLLNEGKLLLALAKKEEVEIYLKERKLEVFKGEKFTIDGKFLVEYLWDIITFNEDERAYPFQKGNLLSKGYYKVIGDKKNIYLFDAEVEPLTFFDSERGKIIIDGGKVEAFSSLIGPCYIGKNSIIRRAKIDSYSSIGEECRIGCEVSNSILEGFSNGAHQGFIGHSYVSRWVNLGAGAIISNLKNTYGEIKVKGLNSKRIFLGAFIGDNVKASIGSYIFCGKTIGVCSHLYGYIVEDVPSFTVYSNINERKMIELDLDSAILTQKRMMERRKVKQSKYDVEVLEKVYYRTKAERERLGIKKERFSLN